MSAYVLSPQSKISFYVAKCSHLSDGRRASSNSFGYNSQGPKSKGREAGKRSLQLAFVKKMELNASILETLLPVISWYGHIIGNIMPNCTNLSTLRLDCKWKQRCFRLSRGSCILA